MGRNERELAKKIAASQVKRAQREAQRNEQKNHTPAPVIKVVEFSAPNKKAEEEIVTSVKVINDTTYNDNLKTISAIYGPLFRNKNDLNNEEIVNTEVLYDVKETSHVEKTAAPEASRFATIKTTLAWLASMAVKVATSPFRAIAWVLSAGASKVASFFPRKKTSNISDFSSNPVQTEVETPVVVPVQNKKSWNYFTPFRDAKTVQHNATTSEFEKSEELVIEAQGKTPEELLTQIDANPSLSVCI